MTSRSKRTLIDNSQLLRRSPRLSSKEPESRVLTPPRVQRTKLIVPQSVIAEQPGRTVGSQVTTEFSDDDSLDVSHFGEATNMDGGTPGRPGTRQWQDRLWTSLLNAKDKGRKQEEPEESWSKRNLFAVFVLIPLIIGLLSLSIWCMTYGVNPLDIVPRVNIPRFLPPSSPSTITIQEILIQEVPNQALDVDLLIDKILTNDMFKEMVTQSTSETDKLVYFAKNKLDAMENELKATNEALIKEMTDKINTAKAKVDELKKVDTHDDLKTQLESLKASIDTVGDNNNDEIAAVKGKIDSLMEKHDELKVHWLIVKKTNNQLELKWNRILLLL